MDTVFEALASVSNYPIPPKAIRKIATIRGVDILATATLDIMSAKEYKLAEADLYVYLSSAPTVREGDVSFSFSSSERESFAKRATEIYAKHGEGGGYQEYGYIGDSL